MNSKLKSQMKNKAVEFMSKLDIYKPYINAFGKRDKVCLFENCGGFYIDYNNTLRAKVAELESKHNCIVYAITHEYTEFGELYDFLIVTDTPEEWATLVENYENDSFCCFAYCWNKSCEDNSEFGDIIVQSHGGGICRKY